MHNIFNVYIQIDSIHFYREIFGSCESVLQVIQNSNWKVIYTCINRKFRIFYFYDGDI